MVNCPKCGSNNVQDTEVCKYSFPSYNEEIPVITDEDYLRKKYPGLYKDKSNG